MNDVILGQITCPKCGNTYPTCYMDRCPYCEPKIPVIEEPKKTIKLYISPEEPDNDGFCDQAIFLGGTIEVGTCIDWQRALSKQLLKVLPADVDINIYNPRRAHWSDNCPIGEKLDQIKWEHHYLDRSDIIVMNILEDSKSPISLMEIGMYADSGNLLVFCPKTFYRYENVFCVCQKYDIPLYDTNDVSIIAEKVLERLNLNLL